MIRKETASILAMLVAGFPQAKVTSETAEVWHEFLQDLPYDEVKVAVVRLITGSEYFPTVAAIRKSVLSSMGMLPMPVDQAWSEVCAAVDEHGLRGKPMFSPIVERIVDAIGWWNICMSTQPDMIRRDFFRAYEKVAGEIQQTLLTPQELVSGMRQIMP